MNIKKLHVKGDFELIVSQVNKNFTAKKPRLKQYRVVVWDAINKFDNFSIEAIPREENHMADNLALSASNLQLSRTLDPHYLTTWNIGKFLKTTFNFSAFYRMRESSLKHK